MEIFQAREGSSISWVEASARRERESVFRSEKNMSPVGGRVQGDLHCMPQVEVMLRSMCDRSLKDFGV